MSLELSSYVGFASVSLLIAISPGPSWVYTISTTLGHGRKAGMIGNLGNSSGILCHGMAVVLGLAAVLQFTTAAFMVLKYLGAAYLGYLALRTLRMNTTLNIAAERSATSFWQIYCNGAFVSMFNPKISLLMLALLPQFIDPSAGNPELQIAIMVAMHAVIAGIVHTHVVFFSGVIAASLRSSWKAQRIVRWVLGGLFFGFGVRLALSSQQ